MKTITTTTIMLLLNLINLDQVAAIEFGPEKCTETNCNKYRGQQTKTKQGYTCNEWTKQTPHEHKYSLELNPYLKDGNYCRNPLTKDKEVWATEYHYGLWCYTTDPKKRWDDCEPMTEFDQERQKIQKDITTNKQTLKSAEAALASDPSNTTA